MGVSPGRLPLCVWESKGLLGQCPNVLEAEEMKVEGNPSTSSGTALGCKEGPFVVHDPKYKIIKGHKKMNAGELKEERLGKFVKLHEMGGEV